MNIIKRLRNAYGSGGISEVIRKSYYHMIYVYNGKKIVAKVNKANYEYGIKRNKNFGQKIIVSMTTYPKRFSDLELCLKSLLLQTIKPDKIIVYLGADSVGMDLPSNIKRFEEYGIEFKIDEENNLRSYKKFFYAMQEYPDDIIITVDDDSYYPPTLIENLIKMHNQYPGYICSNRCHLMKYYKSI